MLCNNCGRENDKDRNVCIHCGNFISKNTKRRNTNPEEARKRRNRNIWQSVKSFFIAIAIMIGFLLIATVIVFFVSYFLTRNMDWPTQEELDQEAAEWEDSGTRNNDNELVIELEI